MHCEILRSENKRTENTRGVVETLKIGLPAKNVDADSASVRFEAMYRSQLVFKFPWATLCYLPFPSQYCVSGVVSTFEVNSRRSLHPATRMIAAEYAQTLSSYHTIYPQSIVCDNFKGSSATCHPQPVQFS